MSIEDRIKEIVLKYCENYPSIETVKPWEQLWAIECSLGGIKEANQDWQDLGRGLMEEECLKDQGWLDRAEQLIAKGKKTREQKEVFNDSHCQKNGKDVVDTG